MGNFTCVEMKGRVVDTMDYHLDCGHVRARAYLVSRGFWLAPFSYG